MSDLFQSESFFAAETFWERVRRVATNIEQEIQKTTTNVTDIDVLMTETPMGEVQGLRSPPMSPITPPVSPIAPVYSPVTPPKGVFPAHPQTLICSPEVSPITPPEQTPPGLKEKSLNESTAPESCETKSTNITSAPNPAGRAQSRCSLPKSSQKGFDIHEDIAVDADPAEAASIAASQQSSQADVFVPALPTHVSHTPAASSLSSTAIAGQATRSRKDLPPVPTTPAAFVTKATEQPVFSAMTGDLIDPVTSCPYHANEIIAPPGLHHDIRANHGSQTRAYINTKVTPTLLKGMKIVAEVEPEKPLWWLGDFLMRMSAELETDGS